MRKKLCSSNISYPLFFKDFLSNIVSFDLRFVGNCFTWSNGRERIC